MPEKLKDMFFTSESVNKMADTVKQFYTTFDKEKISIGEDIRFSFDLIIKEKKKSSVRLEYAVYFMKANGKHTKKVFKLTEKEYAPGTHRITKKHSFADMSTRRHYPGEHQVSIIINGEEKTKDSFDLHKQKD